MSSGSSFRVDSVTNFPLLNILLHRLQAILLTVPPNPHQTCLFNYASQLKRFRGKFAREVKAINENIKVVLTSGYNFSATDISNNGYDEFLQLPVKLSTLVSTVKEMLNS